MNMPASVTMNGASLKRWIRKPCSAPNAAPVASTSAIAAYGFQPALSSEATNMVVSAMTAPTDRSMPPDRITNVIPTATMHRNELSITRLRNTCGERNPS